MPSPSRFVAAVNALSSHSETIAVGPTQGNQIDRFVATKTFAMIWHLYIRVKIGADVTPKVPANPKPENHEIP
jgi:hypothetical protein